jgi:hypothetical protein
MLFSIYQALFELHIILGFVPGLWFYNVCDQIELYFNCRGLFLIPESIKDFIYSNKDKSSIKYRPSSTAKEILRKSQLPYLTIHGIDVPHVEMFNEAKSLIRAMIPHRSEGGGHRGWKSLCLHGISSAHTENADKYGMSQEDPSIYQWTDISRLAPLTTNFFQEKFHYKCFHRLRFMLLEPGGYISPHRDYDDYKLGPVNIALNNPEGCEFYMESVGLVPFTPGTVNKLALVNRHCVVNRSQEPRIHMIIHGVPEDSFWDPLIVKSYGRMVHEQNSSRLLAVES